MTTLKRLAVCFTLITAFTVTASADQTPPCVPGEMNSPPCSGSGSAVTNDSTPGEMNTPPVSNADDLFYSAEAALWSVLLF